MTRFLCISKLLRLLQRAFLVLSTFVLSCCHNTISFAQELEPTKSDLGRQILKGYSDQLATGEYTAEFKFSDSEPPAPFSFFMDDPREDRAYSLHLSFNPRQQLSLKWFTTYADYRLIAPSNKEIYWLRTPKEQSSVSSGRVYPSRIGSLVGQQSWRLFWPDWAVFMSTEGAEYYSFGEPLLDDGEYKLPYWLGRMQTASTQRGAIFFRNDDGFQITRIHQTEDDAEWNWRFENAKINSVYLPVSSTCHFESGSRAAKKLIMDTSMQIVGVYAYHPQRSPAAFHFPDGVDVRDSVRSTSYFTGNGSRPASQINAVAAQLKADADTIASVSNEPTSMWNWLGLFVGLCSAFAIAAFTRWKLSSRKDARAAKRDQAAKLSRKVARSILFASLLWQADAATPVFASNVSCGPASVVFYLAANNIEPPSVEEISAMNSNVIWTLQQITDVTNRWMEVSPQKCDDLVNQRIFKPIIAHLELKNGSGHFVVLCPSRDGQHLKVFDPMVSGGITADKDLLKSMGLTGYFVGDKSAVSSPSNRMYYLVVVPFLALAVYYLLNRANWSSRMQCTSRSYPKRSASHSDRHSLLEKITVMLFVAAVPCMIGCYSNMNSSVTSHGSHTLVELELPEHIVCVDSPSNEFKLSGHNNSSSILTIANFNAGLPCCSAFSVVSLSPAQVIPGSRFQLTLSCRKSGAQGTAQFPLDLKTTVKNNKGEYVEENIYGLITVERPITDTTIDIPQMICDFQTVHQSSGKLRSRSQLLLHSVQKIVPAEIRISSPTGAVGLEMVNEPVQCKDYLGELKVYEVPVDVVIDLDELPLGYQDYPIELKYRNSVGLLTVRCRVVPKWTIGDSQSAITMISNGRCTPDTFTIEGPTADSLKQIREVELVDKNESTIEVSVDGNKLRLTPKVSAPAKVTADSQTVKLTVDTHDGVEEIEFSIKVLYLGGA